MQKTFRIILLVFRLVMILYQISNYNLMMYRLETQVHAQRGQLLWTALCLSGSQGGAVHHHTEQYPWETNGIKTSCLITEQAGDEPESLRSCRLIFPPEQWVVRMCVCLSVCLCTVAAALTWLQEPGAERRESTGSWTDRGNRSISSYFSRLQSR